MGEDWDTMARDRKSWDSVKSIFVRQAIKVWVGERYLRTYALHGQSEVFVSERATRDSQETLRLARLAETNPSGLMIDADVDNDRCNVWPTMHQLPRILMFGDNKAVWEQLAGRYRTPQESPIYETLYQTMLAWRSRGHEFHDAHHTFIMHKPREYNKIADAIANRCLDRSHCHRTWLEYGMRALKQRVSKGHSTCIFG